MEKRKLTTVIAVVILIILGYFGYQYFWTQEEPVQDTALQTEAEALNPFNQEDPDNPFEESSNPYENIKTNPFE